MGSQKKLVSWRPEGEEEEKRVEKKKKGTLLIPSCVCYVTLGGSPRGEAYLLLPGQG